MFIQSWADSLVEELLGSGSTDPASWLQPTLPLTALPSALRPAASTPASPSNSNGNGATVNAGQSAGQPKISPLEAVMKRLDHLVNPPGQVGRVKWEFKSIQVRRKGHGALVPSRP